MKIKKRIHIAVGVLILCLFVGIFAEMCWSKKKAMEEAGFAGEYSAFGTETGGLQGSLAAENGEGGTPLASQTSETSQISQTSQGEEVRESLRTGTLTMDGKSYRRNTAVRAILCIGVDSQGEMETHQASGQAGQADAIILAAQDMARDTVKILMIPRDTMTEIRLFDLMGKELGTKVQHLNLSFAYGSGREESCELLRDAVSNLLFDLNIDGYLAMNISSIARFNDVIGGVPVTIPDEGLETRDPAMTKGTSLTLTGKQAEIFLRYRDIETAQSALTRMDRQKIYMQSYLETVKAGAAKDSGLIPRLMEEVEAEIVTDMAKDQYLDMGLAVLNSQQTLGEGDFYTLPGEGVETELYDEYHPDMEEVKKMIIELFCKEV